MRDNKKMNQIRSLRGRDSGLGPNSAIGARLRALYGAVQEEDVPSHLLDLLERLDAVEREGEAEGPDTRDRGVADEQ